MRRHFLPTLLILTTGFCLGIAYRHFWDPPYEASFANYLRSGVHAMAVSAFAWAAHLYSNARASLWLRRWPIVAEIALRAVVMTVALAVAITALQALFYGFVQRFWLRQELPILVAVSFAFAALFGAVFELTRLIGARTLLSVILGRYRRPARETRVLMFLDVAGSTAMAETLGEVRAQEFLTRFFFDIDDVIVAHGGEVHAYVGDEVIVSWPIGNAVRDGDCVRLFFAIGDRIAARAGGYVSDFGMVPRFRAALHAGPLVLSECGVSRRQIAYFGDTINVAARLQTYCKDVGRDFLVSAALTQQMHARRGLVFTDMGPTNLRGHAQPVRIYAVERSEA